jgi:5-carboxymethyl-2-hydroxymuconate isomerase
MPRLTVEYSAHVLPFDSEGLLQELCNAAAQVDSVKLELIKAKAFQPKIAFIGHVDKGYIFILFEWLKGRNLLQQGQLKKALKQPLLALKEKLSEKEISITLEIREIEIQNHESF